MNYEIDIPSEDLVLADIQIFTVELSVIDFPCATYVMTSSFTVISLKQNFFWISKYVCICQSEHFSVNQFLRYTSTKYSMTFKFPIFHMITYTQKQEYITP